MKYPRLIAILLVMIALSTCHDAVETRQGTSLPAAYPELSAVDSLLWQQPDSALTRLIPYFDTCRDVSRNVSATYNRHYAHLLLAELLYKNYYEQTNRAELQQAVGYFDSMCPCADVAFLDARAHYINGVGYYERDSVVEACKEYLTALEVMETHFGEKELTGKKAQFMALANTHLVTLFSDQYLHEQAIGFGKMSLKYYRKYDAEAWHVAWLLNTIGSHFDIMQNYDSAYFYCKQGMDILPDTNSLVYRDIATHITFLSYEMGASPKQSLNHLYSLLAQAESPKEYASRCLTIGEIYYNEQQFDSAWCYLYNVYSLSQSVGSKKQAAEWLAKIAESQSKDIEAAEFASFLVPFANLEENQSGTKSQITALYNEWKQNQVDYQHHLKIQRQIKQVVTVVGGLLIGLLAVVFLYHRSIQHKKNLKLQIETERQAHKMQQAAMAGRLKRSNAVLKEQEKKHASVHFPSSHQNTKKAENYLEEPICMHIIEVCNDKNNPIKSTVPVSVYANIALRDTQKAELKNAAFRHYGQMLEGLKHRYPQLKEKDFLYCYLCLLGLDNTQIAVLLQNSVSTIWDRESRLKRILGSDDKISVVLNGFLID